MMTFDEIVPTTKIILEQYRALVEQLDWLLINRDLNGRVRFIVPQTLSTNAPLQQGIQTITNELSNRLVPHVTTQDSILIYETDKDTACSGGTAFAVPGFNNAWIVDRLATEANWAQIAEESKPVPRVVFFSIKGGVGRSTALTATAWDLAQRGKRVLVLDLDLESPGLSAALLPKDRQPQYGITDWLVEDLVDNSATVFAEMVATSNLSRDGEIHIVPAHGGNHGEYIPKLGRVWMPKLDANGKLESWSSRLGRLLNELEKRIQPDVVLIDSRSGIDEIASACITDLGAYLILLFAIEGDQTWNGYRMLFEQWQRANVAEKIRERLQIVGAMAPEINRADYLCELRSNAYHVFIDTLYDEIAPPMGSNIGPANDGQWRVDEVIDGWNFDEADEGAPHYPWVVNWHRSFLGLRSLQGRLTDIDNQEVNAIFGSLLTGLRSLLGTGENS